MSTKKISRRDFLKVAGISAAAIGLTTGQRRQASCCRNAFQHRSFHHRQCRLCCCIG